MIKKVDQFLIQFLIEIEEIKIDPKIAYNRPLYYHQIFTIEIDPDFGSIFGPIFDKNHENFVFWKTDLWKITE